MAVSEIKLRVANRLKTLDAAVLSKDMKNQYSEFVKLTEVKEIVEEVTVPLLEAMQTRETEAMRINKTVDLLAIEMKKVKNEARQASTLRNNITNINKNTQKIEQQY